MTCHGWHCRRCQEIAASSLQTSLKLPVSARMLCGLLTTSQPSQPKRKNFCSKRPLRSMLAMQYTNFFIQCRCVRLGSKATCRGIGGWLQQNPAVKRDNTPSCIREQHMLCCQSPVSQGVNISTDEERDPRHSVRHRTNPMCNCEWHRNFTARRRAVSRKTSMFLVGGSIYEL